MAADLTAHSMFGQKGTVHISPHPTLSSQIGSHLVINIRLCTAASVDKNAPVRKPNSVVAQLGGSLRFVGSLNDPETIAFVPSETN